MALTLMQGTIHKSLTCFDQELAALVKSKTHAKSNGVIVSVVEQHGFTYINGRQTNRQVHVVGDETAHLKAVFTQDSEIVHELYTHYFKLVDWAPDVLTFLLEGTIPKAKVLDLSIKLTQEKKKDE